MYLVPRKFINKQGIKKIAAFLKEHHKSGRPDYIPEMGKSHRDQESLYKFLAEHEGLVYSSKSHLRLCVSGCQQGLDQHGFAEVQLPDQDIRPGKGGYLLLNEADLEVRLPTDEDDEVF